MKVAVVTIYLIAFIDVLDAQEFQGVVKIYLKFKLFFI